MGFLEDVVHTVGNAITGGDQTNAAVNAQTNAANQSNETQKYIYDQTRTDQQPWRDAGAKALGQMQDPSFQKNFTMSDFQADPGYQFRMDQGNQAIERSAAARGGLNSGATMKALTDYSQGSASQEYQNAYNRFNNDQGTRFNRLSSLAGVGQTANGTVAAAGQNYGNNVSQTQMGLGNAIGAANIAQANRTTGLIGQGAGFGISALLSSDERVKKNIEPIDKADLAELRSTLKAYRFEYDDPEKYGDGHFIGAMAQDLEKSKLGRELVVEHGGVKMIDTRKLLSLFLATMAEG